MAKAKKQEFYIVTTDGGDYGEVYTDKEDAESDIADMLDGGRADSDQIHVYKGIEVSFEHGVNIKD